MSSYPRIILGVSSTQIYKDDDNLNFYTNNTNVLSINNNGNVGIGKLNPSSKLEVDGDVNISGDLNVIGIVNSINTNILSVEDSMIKLSNNNSADIIDSGFYTQYVENSTTKFSGLFRNSANSEYYLFKDLEIEPTNDVNNSFTLCNLNVDEINANDISISSSLSLNNLNIISGNVNDYKISTFGTSSEYLMFTSNNTQKGILITEDGRLSISGYSNGLFTPNQNIDLEIGSGVGFSGEGSGGSSQLAMYTNGTEKVRIDNNGNVGIGTTQPTKELDVNGDLHVRGTLTVVDPRINIIKDDSFGSTSISANTDNTLTFNISGNQKLKIDNNGNVGIANSTPTEKLDVNGFINSSTGYKIDGVPMIQYQKNTNSLTDGNWYRIAINGSMVDGGTTGTRISAKITLLDNAGGRHNTRTFYISCMFGRQPFFHLLQNSNYNDGSDYISKIRLVEDGLYEGQAIDVYVNGTPASNGITVVLQDDFEKFYEPELRGLTLVDFDLITSTTGFITHEFNVQDNSWGVWTDSISNTIVMNDEGNVGIGESNPSYQLELSTDSAAKPSSSTWTIVSDKRIKEDIQNANLDICYNDIKNIPLRRFKWSDKYIQKYNIKDKHNLGFIAQEVELINKSVINTSNNKHFNIKDFKTLNKDQLIMSLFGAVKKLQNINENKKYEVDERDVIHNSIYEKTSTITDALKILDKIKPFKYLDKNNNKNDISEEELNYLYGIDDKSLGDFFNILYKGKNKYLPTINRNGKYVNGEIELYNHCLNVDDKILISFFIDNIEISKVVRITRVLDTTHVLIDTNNIKEYIKSINNKKIRVYGKKIKNFDYLNLKFLYSLVSFNIQTSKEILEKVDSNKVEINNYINTLNELVNKNKLDLTNNKTITMKIGENFNKLVQQFQSSKNTINNIILENNKLKNENEKLKKQVLINQNNINLINQMLNKQSTIINQLLQNQNK